VQETRRQQRENVKAVKMDNALSEKLQTLKRDQDRNVNTIEQLIRERDMAEAKAKKMEKVLMDDVESLNVTVDVDEDRINALKKPQPATSPGKGKHSRRDGESDEQYEERMARRHRSLVKPFRSMELHEAVSRKKKMLENERESKKQDKQDAIERRERQALEKGMEAGEFR